MSVYWLLGGIDWGESGTRAGVSLNEKLTKIPRHAYNYPSNSPGGCSIFTCKIFEVKNVHKRFDGGEGRSGLSRNIVSELL